MRSGRFTIQGIENQLDKAKVEKALHDVWGVQSVEMGLRNGEVVISYDENAAAWIDVKQAILDSGFGISNDAGTFE